MIGVIHPVAKSDQGHALKQTPAPVDAELADRLPPQADDSGQGFALFGLFTTAVLLVTGTVALLALLGSWWALGLVFGTHVLVTVVVGTAIFRVLGTSRPELEDESRLSLGFTAGPEAQTRPPARSKQTAPITA